MNWVEKSLLNTIGINQVFKKLIDKLKNLKIAGFRIKFSVKNKTFHQEAEETQRKIKHGNYK